MDVWRFADPAWAEIDLTGFDVHAVDERIGQVAEISPRRLVVSRGRATVVLPAGVVQVIDEDARRVDVYRSVREIDAAPEGEEAIGNHYSVWGAGGRVLPVERSGQLLTHIAERGEWAEAMERGVYRPKSLDDVGFVHASTAFSLVLPANLFYRGRSDLVVLCIDQSLLASEVRWEEPQPTVEAFPHIYGPVNLDAVIAVFDFPPGEDGSFETPRAVRDLADAFPAT